MPPPCPISVCCTPTFSDPCHICSNGINYPTTLNISDTVLGTGTITNSFGRWQGIMNVASVTNTLTSSCVLPTATRTVQIRWTFDCLTGNFRLYITFDYCTKGTYPSYDAYPQNTLSIDAGVVSSFTGLRFDNTTCDHMDVSFTRAAIDPTHFPVGTEQWHSNLFTTGGVTRIWHT